MSAEDLEILNKYRSKAEYIVEALFETGSEPDDRCQRISFMGGTYPDRETTLGGFGRSGLKQWLTFRLMSVDGLSPEDTGGDQS